MNSAQYGDEIEGNRVRTEAVVALRAEVAGLQAQVEDLRQSKTAGARTAAALGRVARDAGSLLQAMAHEDELGLGDVGFDSLRSNLAGALEGFMDAAEVDFMDAAEVDLVAAAKRAVELENGPLSKELAAEKATEDAVCPECHGTKKVLVPEIMPGPGPGVIEEISVPCPRCQSLIDQLKAEAS